ncbi:hypothetical protein SLE2022_054360 [Rubroshorea leprosula]
MSFRVKKSKWSPLEVMKDIIEEFREEIQKAERIGCFVKQAEVGGIAPLPIAYSRMWILMIREKVLVDVPKWMELPSIQMRWDRSLKSSTQKLTRLGGSIKHGEGVKHPTISI